MPKNLEGLKVVALLQARGRGSTIPQKNMYPLNGKPMIWHFLQEMKKADFIHEIGVWTECDEIAGVVESCGCHVLHRPRGMVHYGSGFYTPNEWHHCIDEETAARFGRAPYVRVWLNCNHVLFRAETLSRMYRMFVEDEAADMISPIYEIDPDLHMINPETGFLFPVLWKSGVATGEGLLFRKVGMHISLWGFPPKKEKIKEIHLKIPWWEGRDVQEMDDIFFAEYILSRRSGKQG